MISMYGGAGLSMLDPASGSLLKHAGFAACSQGSEHSKIGSFLSQNRDACNWTPGVADSFNGFVAVRFIFGNVPTTCAG